jgi:hypothetical protein
LKSPPVCVGCESGKRPKAVGTQRRSTRRHGAFDSIVNTAQNEVRGKSSPTEDIEIPQIEWLHHDLSIATFDLNPTETSQGLSSVSSVSDSSDDTIVSSSDQDPFSTLREAIDHFIVDAQKEIDQFGKQLHVNKKIHYII